MEGFAVTPAGSPDKEIVTGSVNPCKPPTVMLSKREEPPAVTDTEAGAAEIVKSGTGACVTVRAAVAWCDVAVAVPVTVMVFVAGTAPLAADNWN